MSTNWAVKEGLKPPLTFDILRDLCACACLCFGDVSETREAKAFPKPACREASERFGYRWTSTPDSFNCLPHIPSFWVGSCLLTPAHFFQTSGAPLQADGASVQHTRPVTTKRAEAGPGGRLLCDRIFAEREQRGQTPVKALVQIQSIKCFLGGWYVSLIGFWESF